MRRGVHTVMMRVLLLALGISANSFGASAVNATDSISVPGFTSRPSISTEPVDLQIGDAALRIPRNYLERAYITKPGQVRFSLVATLPDLAGANSATLRCFRSENWSRCGNTLIVRPVATSGQAYYKKIAAELEKATETELIFGLTRFRNTPNLLPAFYYVSADESVAISCNLPTDPVQYCRGYLDTVGGLRVMYQFSPDHLSQWRDLHIALRNLFQTFAKRS